MDPILIFTFILLIICALGLSWFAGSDAPFVSTKEKVIIRLLKTVNIKGGQNFYELGSGDGRVVLEAAKMGAKSVGIEQSWIRVWYSRYKAKKLNLKNAFFFHGNLFDRNYYSADIIYIFLLPQALDKLEKKLKSELKPKSLVITQTFHFKNWKPIKKINLSEKNMRPLSADGKMPGDFWIYKQT